MTSTSHFTSHHVQKVKTSCYTYFSPVDVAPTPSQNLLFQSPPFLLHVFAFFISSFSLLYNSSASFYCFCVTLSIDLSQSQTSWLWMPSPPSPKRLVFTPCFSSCASVSLRAESKGGIGEDWYPRWTWTCRACAM